MENNPYEPPQTKVGLDRLSREGVSLRTACAIVAIFVCAVLTGLAFYPFNSSYEMIGGKNPFNSVSLGLPLIAILIAGIVGHSRGGHGSWRTAARRGFVQFAGLTVGFVAAAGAGYIAFGTTCCCVNGVTMHSSGSPLAIAFVCFAATLLGAYVTFRAQTLSVRDARKSTAK